MREHSAVAKTVDRIGPPLNLRHDPGNQNRNEKRNQLGNIPEARGYCSWRLCRRRIELVSDAVRAESDGGEYGDEDEQAPACAQPVLADEYLIKSRGPGRRRFGRRQRYVAVGETGITVDLQW